jgi:hypothetical protein
MTAWMYLPTTGVQPVRVMVAVVAATTRLPVQLTPLTVKEDKTPPVKTTRLAAEVTTTVLAAVKADDGVKPKLKKVAVDVVLMFTR